MLVPWLWLRSTGFPWHWLDEQARPELLDPAHPAYDDPEAFAAAALAARRALVARLAEPEVAEALLLSNVDAVDRVAALLGSDLAAPNVRLRQRVRLGWAYLQRFCAKNETVSFFGPLAWGTIDQEAAESVSLTPIDPAAGRLARRSVRVEHWALRGLCAAIGPAEPVAPSLHPACDLDGDHLRVPLGKRVTLSADTASVLRAIEAGTATTVPTRLVESGVVRRVLAVPPECAAGPLAIEAAVGRALPVTTRVEELRARFEHETGLTERRALLAELRSVLASATVDTARDKGTAYAGRLPVYEDCQRNLRFRVGGALASVLARRIPPLLSLYRLVAECVASQLNAHYASVVAEDFPVFLHAARTTETITRVRREIDAAVRATLVAAWAGFGWDTEEVEFDDSHLSVVADRLRARFPDHARFGDVLGVGVMSPDVLIAGRDPATLDTVVLGEIHPCVLGAMQSVALPFLDDAAEALAFADKLVCGGRVVLATTDAAYQRSQLSWPVTDTLHEVVVPGATSRCPPERTIPAGRGRVRTVDGIVRFTDRATGRTEDMVTVLSSDLQQVMFGLAGAVLGGETTARLRYHGVVARRRAWAADPTRIPDAPRPAEEFAHYTALRAWARATGLPRRVFFRADTEVKPLYLDWANPIAVDTFAKIARTATRLRFSELTPSPDELWLTDDLGAHTAELRMSYLVPPRA
ncbi:hypothetical protein [Actinokineospora sp.]|uniref:hypothetical protein n=1 Tax=Actinokineospora sp. TaxID=1872133 RepID=UPI004037D152